VIIIYDTVLQIPFANVTNYVQITGLCGHYPILRKIVDYVQNHAPA